ncbi:L-aspartate oxidase [Sinomonas albida]|uniref:L-aspartate oxidase n=1 Tax=Sinomonas albida TaxID=369942 RepID=UPI0010A90739|nr:FAD-binding protein [Sinomonas albida]
MTTAGFAPRDARGRSARRLVVVGSGVAGLFGAISAAEAGAAVVLLTKARLGDSNSMLAQGGFAAVLPAGQCAPGDSVASHAADTMTAGAGLGTQAAVDVMVGRAASAVDALLAHGVAFDRAEDGRLALGLEAAHAFPRILHSGGDASGAGITRALIARLRGLQAEGRVEVIERATATELVLDCGAVAAVEYVADGCSRSASGDSPAWGPAVGPAASVRRRVAADAVLLATGGAGQLFAQTTNPAVATGDGVALAFRAGAVLRDLEFYQFHPTALQVRAADGTLRSSLVSEAVRGEGAVIRDASGRRFVADYHPLGELAPRDAVSRALALHRRAGGGQAYLDATGLEKVRGAGFLARRFPGLDAMTRAAGFDWRREPLPIGPAAHYWMGGVATDLDGATSVPGLYAAGEVACTGVHGANRLASNSLLEGVVFAARAVEHFMGGQSGSGQLDLLGQSGSSGSGWAGPAPRAGEPLCLAAEADAAAEPVARGELAARMEADAGVLRDATGLARAARALAGWRPGPENGDADPETANLLTVARLLVAAAAAREESAGAHYRLDFPDRRSCEHRSGEQSAEAGFDVVRGRVLAGRNS